jgi:diguanylate cyclase (GGDEF)-like protein/PAS domain S-box-containing protein
MEFDMKDRDKTKPQLITELKNARKRILELEQSEAEWVRAEGALRQSEHQLKLITDNLPAYVAYVGLDDLRYRFVNNKFEESYKIPRSQIIGSHIKDIIGQSNYEFAQKYLDIVRQGQATSYENRFVTAGTERWVKVNYVPDINDQGKAESVVVLSLDITERRRAEQALRENEERLDLALSVANDGIWDWHIDSNTAFFDGRYYTMAGYEPNEFPGDIREWEKRVHPDDIQQTKLAIEQYLVGESEGYNAEFRFLHKNGDYMWIRAKGKIVSRDEEGNPVRFVGTHSDITERVWAVMELHRANKQLQTHLVEIKELEAALREQAIRDPLTGVFNRRYMDEVLQQELARTSRKGEALSVVILDLDYLKDVNDNYGHVTGGDKALRALADTLKQMCREEDTLCRYAGDEFLVILCDTPAQVAYKRALQWREAIGKIKITSNGRKFGITFSAGVAAFPAHGSTCDGILQNADRALYRAKELGRDQVVIYQRQSSM